MALLWLKAQGRLKVEPASHGVRRKCACATWFGTPRSDWTLGTLVTWYLDTLGTEPDQQTPVCFYMVAELLVTIREFVTK